MQESRSAGAPASRARRGRDRVARLQTCAPIFPKLRQPPSYFPMPERLPAPPTPPGQPAFAPCGEPRTGPEGATEILTGESPLMVKRPGVFNFGCGPGSSRLAPRGGHPGRPGAPRHATLGIYARESAGAEGRGGWWGGVAERAARGRESGRPGKKVAGSTVLGPARKMHDFPANGRI
jgi:hypothetical protein